MCPKPDQKVGIQAVRAIGQRGFSIVTAIFLLVVMAGLGAAMLTFFTSLQASSAQDLEGSRAYQAARAGIEYGVYQVLQPVVNCPNTTLTDLSGFNVGVTCATAGSSPYTEGSTTLTIYTITSTAGSTTGHFYVERKLTATVSR
jgi:MSHA biogenesis protein MshP